MADRNHASWYVVGYGETKYRKAKEQPMNLTNRLRGKKIAAVMSNGHVLAIQCDDGSEIRVAWVDGNGNVLKGMPIVEGVGVRLKAEGISEIVDARGGGRIDRRAAGLQIPKLGRG